MNFFGFFFDNKVDRFTIYSKITLVYARGSFFCILWNIGWGGGIQKVTKNKNRLVFFCKYKKKKKNQIKIARGVKIGKKNPEFE